jgi:hypothetical protein
MKVSLTDYHPVYVSPTQKHLNAWTNLYETLCVHHGTWAHLNSLLHKSLSLVCVPVSVSPIVARQRLGNYVPAATNTRGTTEESLDAWFSMRSMSYQRRVCGSVYPYGVDRQRLGKDILAATRNCWRRRFICDPCRIKVKQAIRSSHNFLFICPN